MRLLRYLLPALLLVFGCQGGQQVAQNADPVARALGVIAILLTAAHFAWSFYRSRATHREQPLAKQERPAEGEPAPKERPDGPRERLESKVQFSTAGGQGPRLEVILFNPSYQLLLCIKSVELQLRGGLYVPFEAVRGASPPTMAADGTTRTNLATSATYDLEPRKQVTFILRRDVIATLEHIAHRDPDRIWVSVSTYMGEIHRISGNELMPHLETFAKIASGGRSGY